MNHTFIIFINPLIRSLHQVRKYNQKHNHNFDTRKKLSYLYCFPIFLYNILSLIWNKNLHLHERIKENMSIVVNDKVVHLCAPLAWSSFTPLMPATFARSMLWLEVCVYEEWCSMLRIIKIFTDCCWFHNYEHNVCAMGWILSEWSCMMGALMLL